jgi:hypothetical protein
MRKFTYTDTRDWKVADVDGKAMTLLVTDAKGNKRNVEKFDGFRSASRAAKKLGGFAVRA